MPGKQPAGHAKRLARGGAASHLAPVTQADLANRYGLFLDFLRRTGRLDPGADAGVQVTPEAIAPFIAELQARVSSVTVSRTIYKVRRAAECIAPHLDFAWLAEIGKDLVLLERPKEDFARDVAPERLVEAGLTLIREAERDMKGNWLKPRTCCAQRPDGGAACALSRSASGTSLPSRLGRAS